MYQNRITLIGFLGKDATAVSTNNANFIPNQHAARREPLRGGQLGQRRHQWQAFGHGGDGDGDAVGNGLAQRGTAQQCQTRHRGAAGQGQRQHFASQFT